mgnify:CR=1 FL=1
MPYIRPPLFVRRVFNPLAMRFGISGTEVLTVTRRRSRTPQRLPVISVQHDGGRYLVSPRGDTDWVRNLRATPRCTLGRRGRELPFEVTEVPVERRAPIIAAYRAVAGRAVKSFFERMPDPGDHPVFLVGPAGGASPSAA